MTTYKIIRFYAASNKSSKVQKTGLTLEEAQAHCSLESTHEAGVWFDGYTKEDNS